MATKATATEPMPTKQISSSNFMAGSVVHCSHSFYVSFQLQYKFGGPTLKSNISANMYGPESTVVLFGLIMSESITFSLPYLLLNNLAHSMPSWPRPPSCFFLNKVFFSFLYFLIDTKSMYKTHLKQWTQSITVILLSSKSERFNKDQQTRCLR